MLKRFFLWLVEGVQAGLRRNIAILLFLPLLVLRAAVLAYKDVVDWMFFNL